MRDQWRADDDHYSQRERRERDKTTIRRRSPTSPRRSQVVELGLKIKGRAAVDNIDRAPSRTRDRSRDSRKVEERSSQYTAARRSERDGSEPRVGEEKTSYRHQHHERASTHKRQRNRTVTPEGRISSDKKQRRRSRTPERRERAQDAGSKRHTRLYSPEPTSSRRLIASSYKSKRTSPERVSRETYIAAPNRYRSKSPKPRRHHSPNSSHRRLESPIRSSKPSEYHSHEHRHKAKPATRDYRRSPSPRRPREPHPRALSPVKERRPERYRGRSRSSSPVRPKHSDRRKDLSRSPERRNRGDQKMQSSTRPIQSILDESPRQPSPPRPIPSFEDSNGIGDSHINQAFPLHGMKASDIHANHRRVPPHIDTRQSFSSSPQYMTPTSSHHGSPQSGSPYSHGRGGWGAPQHFHGQPG